MRSLAGVWLLSSTDHNKMRAAAENWVKQLAGSLRLRIPWFRTWEDAHAAANGVFFRMEYCHLFRRWRRTRNKKQETQCSDVIHTKWTYRDPEATGQELQNSNSIRTNSINFHRGAIFPLDGHAVIGESQSQQRYISHTLLRWIKVFHTVSMRCRFVLWLVDKALLCCWSEASLKIHKYTIYKKEEDN